MLTQKTLGVFICGLGYLQTQTGLSLKESHFGNTWIFKQLLIFPYGRL